MRLSRVIPSSTLPRMRRKRAASKIKMGANLRAELEKQMGKVGYAINQLMSRPKVPAFIGKKEVKLQSEQILSINLADRLRELSQQCYDTSGRIGLKAVWSHCANERQAGWFTHLVLHAMGMLPGAPDFTFVWKNGGGLIELKVDGDLKDNQIYFQRWSHAFEVNHAVCRSVDSAIDKLIAWGAIVGIPAHGEHDVNVKEGDE